MTARRIDIAREAAQPAQDRINAAGARYIAACISWRADRGLDNPKSGKDIVPDGGISAQYFAAASAYFALIQHFKPKGKRR